MGGRARARRATCSRRALHLRAPMDGPACARRPTTTRWWSDERVGGLQTTARWSVDHRDAQRW
ncbi:hypothetical protein DB32_000417 [Sandaracinus amylolyticus]|uniref:Uncharacterized protein n=1 Tax=Sandaracinus amylolyticus TaxID=927083 RepID=A0A0F6VZ14_9BACT|nr:hypothetical protein DB32_000417 [Sandaracinus amylolyticus]